MHFLLLLLTVSLAGGHHAAPKAGRRTESTVSERWSFNDCKSWDDKERKVLEHTASATLKDIPPGFNNRQIVGNFKLGDDQIGYHLYLEKPIAVKSKGSTNTWASISMGSRNEDKYFQESTVYQEKETAGKTEKILVIPTVSAKTSPKNSTEFHQVAMISSSGDLVEAKIIVSGGNFHAFKVLKTCGNGFGFTSLLNGTVKEVHPHHRGGTSTLGNVDKSRHQTIPVGFEYSENETAILQELLLNEAKLLRNQ